MIQICISHAFALPGIIMILDFLYIIYTYIRTGLWIKMEYNYLQTYATVITLFGVVLLWGGINPVIWISGN